MARQPIDWVIIVEDESFFTYESKIRAIWALKGSKPIMLTTGSKKKICMFGAIAQDGTQLFRSYGNTANSDEFLKYLKELVKKFPRMILYMDKATYHKKEARVKRFLKINKYSIKVKWFPSGFPEANPMEECWNQGKEDVLGSMFYNSFNDFKKAVTQYYRTKRFKLDLYKYLCH